MSLPVDLATPITMVGAPRGTAATATASVMVPFTSDVTLDGMDKVPIAMVLAVDSGFRVSFL